MGVQKNEYTELLNQVQTLGNSSAQLSNGKNVVEIISKYIEDFEKIVDKNMHNLHEDIHKLTKNLTNDLRGIIGANPALDAIDKINDDIARKNNVPIHNVTPVPPDDVVAFSETGSAPMRSDEEIITDMNDIASDVMHDPGFSDVNAPYLRSVAVYMEKMQGLEERLSMEESPDGQREIKNQMLQVAAKLADALDEVDPDIAKLSDSEQSDLGVSETGRPDNIRSIMDVKQDMARLINEFAGNNGLDATKLTQQAQEMERQQAERQRQIEEQLARQREMEEQARLAAQADAERSGPRAPGMG